jgi:PAS domain S-box-containing protein
MAYNEQKSLEMNKKENIKEHIDSVLGNKTVILETAYSKSLEQLVEELKIYQYELEFQNSELIRIQSDLEVSRNDYKQLFQNAPIAYLVLDIDLRITECNTTFLNMVTQLDALEKRLDFRRFIHPGDQDLFHFFTNDMIKGGGANQIEIRLMAVGNICRYVNIVANIFHDSSDGRFFRFAISDISDRKQSEEQLLKTKEMLHKISFMAKVGGWELDLDANQLKWSEVTYDIHEQPYDYQPDLESGILFYREGENRAKIRKLIFQTIETGKSFEGEFQIVTSKGNIRWVKVIGEAKLCDNKCKVLVGTIQDIDEKRKAVALLKMNELRLAELNATKDKFFSIIAHDLRSPFNTIIGFSNLLVEQIQQKDYDGIEEMAGYIQDSSNRAMLLLMNLLVWARSQTGSIEFSPVKIDLSLLISDQVELLGPTALQKKIAILKDFQDQVFIFADPEMVKTILRNLISNAIKFTYPEGVIHVSVKQTVNETTLSVIDNGVGINSEAIAKLFRIEKAISTKGTTQEAGTGLGLILCKEFVERHGGKIWVESEAGSGSKFHFTIPLFTL